MILVSSQLIVGNAELIISNFIATVQLKVHSFTTLLSVLSLSNQIFDSDV